MRFLFLATFMVATGVASVMLIPLGIVNGDPARLVLGLICAAIVVLFVSQRLKHHEKREHLQ